MASSQRSTLIPAEYPIVCGSIGDTHDSTCRPGVTFSTHDSTCRPGVTFSTQTVRIPSDRRLIMIPASIPIPLNSIIAAVLFAPLSSSSTSNEAGNPSDILSGETGRLYDAVSQAPADDCGTFVRLDIQPPPAEAQSLAERGRSVVAALIRNANAGNKGRLPTVAEESPGPNDSKGNSVQAVDDINDYDILTSISDIESDALTFGTNTPLLPPQILSTTHTSPEASSAASASARGSKKRQLEEPEATDADKPKKPRNSFFYFRREYHRQANANGSRIKAKSISALAGREWQGMTEEQKEPYKLFAAEDTVRYKEEAKVYKESLKKGKKKVKLVDRIGDTGVGYSVGYVVDASGTSGSYRSTPADGGMILSRLEPVPMLNNMGNSAHSVDILSYMSDMAVEVSTEFEHTPGLFGEPMILTVNPNGILTTDISTQPTFVSADYNDHAISSGSMGPPPLAMAAQHHHSIFQPTSEQHQYAYEYHQYAPDHNSTYSHQHQQFAHHQPHLDYSQAHHAQMQQHWGSISSLLGNLGTPAVYNPFDESLLPVFSESGEPSLQSTMPESIRHTAHVDQAMTMLNSHQLNMATAVIGAESSAALNGPTSTSEHLTGIHPSIPDIEIVDASNSISLSTYSVARRR